MCILFIYTNPNPSPGTYRLIIISNRDEFYSRPAQQICRTEDVIGGRDLEPKREGGMWLGVSVRPVDDVKFRFGALLNVTGEGHRSDVKGRGFLVTDYLSNDIVGEEYIYSILNGEEEYNGFNFVTVEIRQNDVKTYCGSNISKSNIKYEGEQILGFGNTPPDNPLKKVIAGTDRFKEIIKDNNKISAKDELLKKLIDLLKWDVSHLPDLDLEKRQPVWYKGLSCVFVQMVKAGYGSRTHSIILVDSDWNMEFFEATLKEPININDPIWLSKTVKARL